MWRDAHGCTLNEHLRNMMNFTVWVLQEWKKTLACQGAVVSLRSFGLKLEHERNHEAMKQWRHEFAEVLY